LKLALCVPLIAMQGMGSPGVERNAAAALECFGRLDDTRGTFAARRLLWNHSLMHYPVAQTLAHALQLTAQAEASGDVVEQALAHRAIGCSFIYTADFRRAATLLERGFRIAAPVPDGRFEPYGEQPGMVCRSFCAWPKAFMGLRDEAIRLSEEAIELARRRDEPQQLAFALVTAGLVHRFHEDVDRAAAVATEVAALANQYHLAQWLAFAYEIRGWVAFRAGKRLEGIALMSRAVHRLHATGARTHSSRLLANLAESCLSPKNRRRRAATSTRP
jgi:tetratricopeptide (TPR) repeat protein